MVDVPGVPTYMLDDCESVAALPGVRLVANSLPLSLLCCAEAAASPRASAAARMRRRTIVNEPAAAGPARQGCSRARDTQHASGTHSLQARLPGAQLGDRRRRAVLGHAPKTRRGRRM